jgi:2-polyprenyl-3-methyl-5-hydroxy-6-metoxy-1,4-benzoquinol methylase
VRRPFAWTTILDAEWLGFGSYAKGAPVIPEVHTPDGNAAVDLAKLWSDRARTFGARCVINLTYRPEEYEEITKRQREFLFPLLQRELTGTEKMLLDFGCGPGRFSQDLADTTGCRVFGIDVCPELIALAPQRENVTFVTAPNEVFFAQQNDLFDVIWISLVLGGIPDASLIEIAAGLTRLLTEGGLLFMIEHTSESQEGNSFWKFRSIETYRKFFPLLYLNVAGAYVDFGEEVSVITGRRRAPQR